MSMQWWVVPTTTLDNSPSLEWDLTTTNETCINQEQRDLWLETYRKQAQSIKTPKSKESEQRMKLFQYAIIFRPRETKAQRDAGESAKAEILHMHSVMGKDEAEVRVLAARAIPADYASRLDQVEILVRAF